MNSQLTPDFRAHFARLPESVQDQARRIYRVWRDNPDHPSLHFKKIHGYENLYSARVGLGWRVLGLLEGNTVTWFWIGSHADYDRLIGG